VSEFESAHYWCGYLAQALRGIAAHDREPTEQEWLSSQRALREYESSPVHRLGLEMVGYAVVDRQGECYAIRTDVIEAQKARGEGVDYLIGAVESGHPRAAGWVAARLPLAILTITEEERIEMLENGTPTLDREP